MVSENMFPLLPIFYSGYFNRLMQRSNYAQINLYFALESQVKLKGEGALNMI